MSTAKIKYTSQHIDNFGFDEEYMKPTVELLTENSEGTALSTQKKIATEAKQDSMIEAINNISGTSTYNYIQSDTTATYKYYGFASATGWRIKRKTLSSGIWQVAQGEGNYDAAFSDRANKTYNYAI